VGGLGETFSGSLAKQEHERKNVTDNRVAGELPEKTIGWFEQLKDR